MKKYLMMFLFIFLLVLSGQAQDKQKIYLTNGKIVEGVIVEQKEGKMVVETDYGQVILEKSKIARIEFNKNVLAPQNSMETKNDDVGFGKAFLYESRKKKVGTAVGFQVLGAGLIYAEKYGLGSVMMLLENGLIIGGAFIDSGSGQTALWIAGLLLKSINTFFTIKAVNDYNHKLAVKMGLEQENVKTKQPFRNPGHALHLEAGGKGGVGINIELRLNEQNLLNPTIGFYEADGIRLVPSISFVHLFGHKYSRFELGGGIGSFPEWTDDDSRDYSYQYYSNEVVKRFFEFHLIAGYRYQKKNGLLFRIGITPIFSSNQNYLMPHLSFGYSW